MKIKKIRQKEDADWEASMRRELSKSGVTFKQSKKPTDVDRSEFAKNAEEQREANKAKSPNEPVYVDESLLDNAQNALEDLFPDALSFIMSFDPDLASGKYTLYNWQARLLLELSKTWTERNPLKLSVRAVNGSGKDRFIIAALAVWAMLTKAKTKIVITTASAAQLANQTEKYIGNLCRQVNARFKCEFFDIKQRKISGSMQQSECLLFATDEPGKAEGYHPESSDQNLIIIVNEAKTVSDEIFEALERCTGWCIKLYISSPGAADGAFYRSQINATWNRMVVKAVDCPHFTDERIRDLKAEYGENHPLIRSMLEADFGSDQEQVVIPLEFIRRCISNQPTPSSEDFVVVGLDLAAGGNENCAVARRGNTIIGLTAFTTANTTLTASRLDLFFRQYDVKSQHIYADASGVGIGILDSIRDNYGWTKIRYVMNNHSPRDTRIYANLGTENWFHVRRLIEECRIRFNIPGTELLVKQLSNRFYLQKPVSGVDKYLLESKKEALAHGRPSPDRADALVLCFCEYQPWLSSRKQPKPLAADDPLRKPFNMRKVLDRNQLTDKGILGISPDYGRELNRLRTYLKSSIPQ